MLTNPQPFSLSPQPKLWLSQLGFRYDPFRYLEASNDPHLSSYLVGHQLFAVAWEEHPALIFAPAGGGKTAMRMYASSAYWLSQGRAQPFPIPYLATNGTSPSPEQHQRSIARAGSVALLIGLIHHPALLLERDQSDRRAIAALLDAALPAPLRHYLAMLRSEPDPTPIIMLLEKSYRLPTGPPALVLELCAALGDMPPGLAPDPAPPDLMQSLFDILLEVLSFRSIILQIDGVDASADTGTNPAAMSGWLAWPLAQASLWAERRIILKCFLPSELATLLPRAFSESLAHMRQATMLWTPPLLAEVIRRRVYEASDGKIGSLDAISSPGLRDVDTLLARSAEPLPRETIVLVGRLLAEYAHRTGGSPGQIEPEDLEAAQAWYAMHRVDPGPLSR